ncbi:MAG: DUF1223 domain-containing protein [Rhodobacteraceae bacterium]|nr:DUF1223 domain-containing protein [Paracoccaceae bacterium]
MGNSSMITRISMAMIGSALLVFAAVATEAAPRLKTPIILELFTSQGCSSCPPADRLVTKMASSDEYSDVLVLGFHVDYWDYLGWADIFSSKAFSDYQRAYARATGRTTIYTPQIIVQGRDIMVGSSRQQVEAALARARSLKRRNMFKIIGSEDRLQEAEVEFPSEITSRGVSFVRFHSGDITTDVRRGENAGARITYTNVVRDMASYTEMAPGTHRIADLYDLELVEDDECLVMFVHARPVGPIDSAVVLPYGSCI